jgi:hypothetical protein
MTIAPQIFTDLTNLEAQVSAATPLANASHSTIVALQLNATNLLTEIQAALVATPNLLDTYTAPNDPATMVSGYLGVLAIAQDQNNLSLMRGVVGRATSNLEQI